MTHSVWQNHQKRSVRRRLGRLGPHHFARIATACGRDMQGCLISVDMIWEISPCRARRHEALGSVDMIAPG